MCKWESVGGFFGLVWRTTCELGGTVGVPQCSLYSFDLLLPSLHRSVTIRNDIKGLADLVIEVFGPPLRDSILFELPFVVIRSCRRNPTQCSLCKFHFPGQSKGTRLEPAEAGHDAGLDLRGIPNYLGIGKRNNRQSNVTVRVREIAFAQAEPSGAHKSRIVEIAGTSPNETKHAN